MTINTEETYEKLLERVRDALLELVHAINEQTMFVTEWAAGSPPLEEQTKVFDRIERAKQRCKDLNLNIDGRHPVVAPPR